jgi:DNA invertase Pin-like site-specific DNA recombinase
VADDYGLLQVSAEQRGELESWAQSRSLPAGDVFRARLIFALADGLSYREIERKLGASAPTVSKWKRRFEQAGSVQRVQIWQRRDRHVQTMPCFSQLVSR